MLDVSENTFRKIEGDKVVPKKEMLEKIAEKLGMKVEELVRENAIILYENIQNCTNSNIGSNGVINHRNVDELAEENQTLRIENEKLKVLNDAREQRIEDIGKQVKHLEEIVELLNVEKRANSK